MVRSMLELKEICSASLELTIDDLGPTLSHLKPIGEDCFMFMP